jgi:hypothetical protein
MITLTTKYTQIPTSLFTNHFPATSTATTNPPSPPQFWDSKFLLKIIWKMVKLKENHYDLG